MSKGDAGPEGDGAVSKLLVAAGLVLFVIHGAIVTSVEGLPGEFAYAPFTPEPLPFAAMRGFTFEQLVAHVTRICLATPGLLLVWLGIRGATSVGAPGETTLTKGALVCSALSVLLSAFVMFFVLEGRAIVDDEIAYKMQADFLADGRLALGGLPAVPVEAFNVSTPLGFTGKYLFGEPLLQVPGVLVGMPALLHLPLALLTLYGVFRATELVADREIAAWATILVAASPMFILTTATRLSQPTALFCAVMAVFGYALARAGRAWGGTALAGMAIGFCAAVRPQVAVPVGAVVVVGLVFVLGRKKRWGPILLLFLALAGWAAVIGAYNHALTGSVLELPWYAQQIVERFGFGQVFDDDAFRHTPLVALENLLVVAVRFNAWWIGWPSSFLLLYLWYKWGRGRSGATAWLWVALAVVLFEALYYSTGISDTGAVYHYELLVPAALLGANALKAGFRRNPRSTAALLAVHFGLGWTSFSWLETQRLDRLTAYIYDDVEAALARVEPPALLFYEPRCDESLRRGWVHDRFPFRNRSERYDIVVYPRPRRELLGAYLDKYPGRRCYYFRINRQTQEPDVLTCSRAEPLLSRPTKAPQGQCLWNPPTATRLGWYDPWAAIAARALPED